MERCPLCGKEIEIKDDGLIANHTVSYGQLTSWLCVLSGLSPLEAVAIVDKMGIQLVRDHLATASKASNILRSQLGYSE